MQHKTEHHVLSKTATVKNSQFQAKALFLLQITHTNGSI